MLAPNRGLRTNQQRYKKYRKRHKKKCGATFVAPHKAFYTMMI